MRQLRTVTVERSRIALVALMATALIAGLTVLVSAGAAAPAAAIGHTPVGGGEVLIPAPVRSLPICQTIPDPDIGGCFDKSDVFSVSVSGSLDASGATTLTVVPTIPACVSWTVPTDTWSGSPCYSKVAIAGDSYGNFRCVWLEDSSGDLNLCPNLYRDGTRSLDRQITRKQTIGGVESAGCVAGGDFRTYVFGGPAGVPGARWSERAPDALDCTLTLDGPTPDNLMGASWIFVSVRLTVQESGRNGLGRFEFAEGYMNVNGFLGPDAPDPTTEDPPDDPNVPGGDPFEPLGPFTDVPAGSFARADIELLLDLGITTGTSASTYGPGDLVTREQMAAFLARLWRALGETCPSGASPFTDVSPSSFAKDDIACIFGLGITTGLGGTTYGPGDLVTREQMAAFLARLWRALGETCPGGASPFTDVGPSSFAKDDIACIFGLGITKGTSATTYGPSEFVTREQMAAFLARTYRLRTNPT